MKQQQSEQITTFEDEKQYHAWKEELVKLENINPDGAEEINWEYVEN